MNAQKLLNQHWQHMEGGQKGQSSPREKGSEIQIWGYLQELQ